MSSSKRPHDPLSALNHTALNANVDGLWRYQLRDENRALFLKVEALEKASRALPAKLDQRFNETTSSIEALIARVAAIEEENRQIKEDRQVCRDELASLKEQLRAMQQQDLGESICGCVKTSHSL
jgi:predicted nuclease with TOPRIM domain